MERGDQHALQRGVQFMSLGVITIQQCSNVHFIPRDD